MAKIRRVEFIGSNIIRKKRVAAYARVSMQTELLLHSLSAQVSALSGEIQENPEWEFAGVFVDVGISGRSIDNRTEFLKMIQECENGKIDMVLVKSISRFARDIVDFLTVIRKLNGLGVDVYFEREKIHTISSEGEIVLTLMAAFAQAESENISQNIKWTIRKLFEEGEANCHHAPYGYRWDGEMYRIVPEQGEIVKRIYASYLAGDSAYKIANELAAEGIVGNKNIPLDESTIKDILTSESYMGTQILQKNYMITPTQRRRNKGQLPRYAVDGMFEPLVSPEDFAKAVEIRKARAEAAPNRNPPNNIFTGIVKCGTCGRSVSRRMAKGIPMLVCNGKERCLGCDMVRVKESDLLEACGDRSLVQSITIYDAYFLITLKNGQTRKVTRSYGGHRKKCAFSSRVLCGNCGGTYHRASWNRRKVWICPKTKAVCSSSNLPDDELRKAAKSILGEHYEQEFVSRIRSVVVFVDRLEFTYKNGEIIKWQRR